MKELTSRLELVDGTSFTVGEPLPLGSDWEGKPVPPGPYTVLGIERVKLGDGDDAEEVYQVYSLPSEGSEEHAQGIGAVTYVPLVPTTVKRWDNAASIEDIAEAIKELHAMGEANGGGKKDETSSA